MLRALRQENIVNLKEAFRRKQKLVRGLPAQQQYGVTRRWPRVWRSLVAPLPPELNPHPQWSHRPRSTWCSSTWSAISWNCWRSGRGACRRTRWAEACSHVCAWRRRVATHTG